MYAKAHPFGYIKQRTNKSKRVQCNGTQCTRVQTITMVVPVIYPIYDNKGNQINTVQTTHIQTKNIYHTDISHKSGYTLAEIYYNSVLNSEYYNAFQNKYSKKNKNLTD